MIVEVDIKSWAGKNKKPPTPKFLTDIETGHVLFFPQLPFQLLPQEQKFLNPIWADLKSKNISYDSRTSKLRGSTCQNEELKQLKDMMHRFANNAYDLINHLFPHYQKALQWGRTSFRTMDVAGRIVESYRKDDTRLHVDAFASTPIQGLRLLRVFSNVNPQHPRLWKLGEPFEDVAKRFLPHVSKQAWLSPYVLNALKITKGLRTPYDHIMLQIHDSMKHDLHYQKIVPQQDMAFPSNSTWVVMTDQVSHAALVGQFMLEQTFYLPPEAMQSPEHSPLRVLERLTGRKLVEL